MAQSIVCPQVGQDLTEAKVVALHVKLGDTVKKGDIVAEVESEKASFEVEAFAAGTVIALPYKVGDVATVLEPLVVLGVPGEAAATAAPATAKSAVPVTAAPADEARLATSSAPERALSGTLRSSPLARRIAANAGLDIAALAGSGPRGAVVLQDVEKALAAGGASLRTRSTLKGRGALAIRSLRNGTGHTVLFIHGFGSDLSSWRPLVASLAISNPMLGIDLPAHGGSVTETADNFESLCAEVAASLAAAGHRSVHLVGHSLGAAVCAALADRDDLDVRSLTLLSPAGLAPRIDGDFIEGFLQSASEAALTQWMKRLVHAPQALPQAFVRATLSARESASGLVAAQTRLVRGLFEGSTQLFSVLDDLGRYGGPCRVIVGRRDRIIPAEQADALPGHIALNRLEAVGHLPQVEALAIVSRFVSETVRAAG